MHRFKYAGRADLARPLSELMRRAIPREIDRVPEIVVPVPLHPARIVERGFNQAALLAGPIACRLGVAFRPRALERVRDTPRQATLDRVRRATNLDGAFRVRDDAVEGKHVLLVDDVRTTGATLHECERTLRARRAALVSTLVLASVD
jgi:ComF family protein